MLKLESSRCVVLLSVREYTRTWVSSRPKWGFPWIRTWAQRSHDCGRSWCAGAGIPRYGYRRLQVVVEREGERVNHKRHRKAGLCLKQKTRPHCVHVGSPRPALTGANQEWALDFAHDVIAAGRNIRVPEHS